MYDVTDFQRRSQREDLKAHSRLKRSHQDTDAVGSPSTLPPPAADDMQADKYEVLARQSPSPTAPSEHQAFTLTLPRRTLDSSGATDGARTVAISIIKPDRPNAAVVTPLTAREERLSYFPLPKHARHRPDADGSSSEDSFASVKSGRSSSSRKLPSEPLMFDPSPISVVSKAASSVAASASPKAKRRDKSALKLTNLPRYHPAYFQGLVSPRSAPMSPSQRGSDAQAQLHRQQREIVKNVLHVRRSSAGSRHPTQPQLEPLGSPGPVTPLMLELADCYLSSGTPTSG